MVVAVAVVEVVDARDVLSKPLCPDEKLEAPDDDKAPDPAPPVVTPDWACAVVPTKAVNSRATRHDDAERMNNGFTVEEMVCPARIGNGVNGV